MTADELEILRRSFAAINPRWDSAAVLWLALDTAERVAA